jgi:hypothetical protein
MDIQTSNAMQVNDLKYNLLDKLISIRDISVLKKINDLIGNVDINTPVFKTTDGQRQMLAKSEEDIVNDKLISDEELNEEEDR